MIYSLNIILPKGSDEIEFFYLENSSISGDYLEKRGGFKFLNPGISAMDIIYDSRDPLYHKSCWINLVERL